MELLWSLPYLVIFIWLIPKIRLFRESGISTAGIRLLFAIKALMGVGLIMVYTYYYPPGSADIFNYFEDGKVLFSALNENPLDYLRMMTGIQDDAPHLMYYYDQMNFWLKDFNYDLFNDNRTVIRFNAFFMLFSFKNIYVHTYIMNILSLTGLVGIFRFLHEVLSIKKVVALIAIALPFSLLFWGSGLLKEGIVLFALGILLFSMVLISENAQSRKGYLLLIFALAIFSISKFYVLFAIIPGLLSLWASKFTRKPLISFLTLHILFVLFMFTAKHFGLPDFPDIISQKQNDFINYVQSLNHVGSYIEGQHLSPHIWDFVVHGVRGFFITLFRPHPMEVHNVAMVPAALENLITILFIFIALIFRNKKMHISTFLFCASFTVILFALAGMTTPVLGALVRYKIPAQPFLYALLLMSIHWTKILNFLQQKAPDTITKLEKIEQYLYSK